MNLPHHTAYDFIVFIDYKISLKFVFPICRINFRIQHLTCPIINHRTTFHHNAFLKCVLCEFLIVSAISLWSYTCWSMICCLQSSSRHIHTGGCIWTKNNLLIPFDGVFDSFFKLFPCFHTISTGYIQLFCKL